IFGAERFGEPCSRIDRDRRKVPLTNRTTVALEGRADLGVDEEECDASSSVVARELLDAGLVRAKARAMVGVEDEHRQPCARQIPREGRAGAARVHHAERRSSRRRTRAGSEDQSGSHDHDPRRLRRATPLRHQARQYHAYTAVIVIATVAIWFFP